MESKWLEDFVSLAETGSFSRSALLRNVTQPAFSRRIQSLEAWVGVDLIDRTSYPTRLTQAGHVFYEQALTMLNQLNTSRAMLRGQGKVSEETIELAVPHTLSFVFVPKWIKLLEKQLGPIKSRLLAGNVHDAVLALAEGTCDLLICYHHPNLPVQLDSQRYDMKVLGSETVSAYSKCDRNGAPLYSLPGKSNARVPFLSYSANAYIGRVVDRIREKAKPNLYLDQVYETDMSEGLKMMAIEGLGVAWLPDSAVSREVKAKSLAKVDERFQETMEIRLYREKPSDSRKVKEKAEQVWQLC
jgi:LysR family transcriptional regulator, hypochlorite-specific transcription factor HypT